MKKILDILLVAMLFVLLINFFNSDPQEKALNGKVFFEVTDKSYTVPATVGLKVTNNTEETLTVNNCKNVSINYAGESVTFPENFCKDIEVLSGESGIINYGHEFALFQDTGKYTFKINLGEKEYIDSFEIEHKGTFNKLFTALFYAPVYNLMIFLIELFSNSMGWAIITITVLMRLVLLWPQHKMMISQKKLQTLQPKIKEIQKQYKGNQQMLGMKMMELYKKEKVNPMGSCGFLLIQMPILLVMYNVILSIKDPSNHYHLYQSLTHFNLSAINFDFFGLDLLSKGGLAGILLGLTVGIIQFIQVKLSLAGKQQADKKGVVLEKKKDSSDYSQMMPDPEMMNKFMLYGMPAMVAVFTYTLFAGVGIYWGISTLFMILQQLVVNKILKK